MLGSPEQTSKHRNLSSTKQALLEKLRRGQLKAPAEEQVIKRQPKREHYPLSFAQQRLWFLHQLHPLSPAYNVRNAILLRGLLNIPALELSLSEIIRRHEPLRTRFSLFDSQPVQIIDPPFSVHLPVEDLSHLPDPHSAAIQLARDEASTAFDLERGPVIRLRLLRLSEHEHVLLLSVHHIAFDGWSTGVLVRELRHLYAAFREGRQHSLPEPPVSYADYAVWQRQWLSGSRLDEQLDYWREQLKGAPAVLELPSDHSRPAVRSERGARQRVEIEAELVERLREVGKREGATLYMVLLAGWKALLMRYSGEREVVVGTPVAGRGRGEVEGLIGLFINMVAVRTRVEGGERFEELVRKVKESALGAYGHQELPFERLVEELDLPSNTNSHPVFQTIFQLQNTPSYSLELDDLNISRLEIDSGTSKFDMSLYLIENRDGRLTGQLEYSTDLYEEETISRMLSHYLNLLSAAAANPSLSISRLPLLTTEQRRELLSSSSNIEALPAHLSRTSVTRLFEQQVEQTPEAVALVCGGRSLTYRQLNERANGLARRLRRAGVGPEQRVGILVERSIEFMVAVVAALKAGGAYVPLDPEYPWERLEYMMRDAGLKVLLLHEELAASWAMAPIAVEKDMEVILLGEEDESRAGATSVNADAAVEEDARNLVCEVDGENLAYVMYTSGSTGNPKGVVVTHRGIVRLVKETDYAEFGPNETFLQCAPLTFDVSTFEIWGSLLHGGRLVLIPGTNNSLKELAEAIEQHHVTSLWLTAGLFHLMVEEHLDSLRSLRQLLAGGDVLSPAHVRRAVAGLPNCRVINGYGPTENTTFTCCHVMESLDQVGTTSVPIGKAINGTDVYILDEHFEPVPVGVPGELYTGGYGVARGYLNRPGMTAEKFVPHPYSHEPGGRLYRTGDLARWLSNGCIEFLGRADNQVKVRGYRVELGEIETCLEAHDRVKQAVVVIRKDASGEKYLAAFVVPKEETTVAELNRYLKERLPDYMIPSAIALVDELPLTANGKIDRQALSLSALPESEDEDSYVAPGTPVEEVIAGIWSRVLGREQIGIHSSFFNLGGHSLSAMRVISGLHDAFGIQVNLRTFFEEPTIAELAAELLRDPLQRDKVERTAQLLLMVSELSDDQVQTMLNTDQAV